MSELCNSKCHFSTLLISDLILLCSFILAHPLYFSYVIFFSPYLVKLISFLSPLFITTFILSLAFLIHGNFYAESSQTIVTHLLTRVLEKLRSKRDNQNDESQSFEDLGMYEILFGSVIEVRENPVELFEAKSEEDLGIDEGEDFAVNKVDIDPSLNTKLENNCAEMEEKRLENFLKILDDFEKMSSNVEENKKVEPSRGAKAGKVVEKPKAESLYRNGSKAINDVIKVSANNSDAGKEITSLVKSHSQRITSIVDHDAEDDDRKSTSKTELKSRSQRITSIVDHDAEDDDRKSTLKAESSRSLDVNKLGNYGSMRKEKEWKRTLACKLFEERHNVDGGEGMDSLWEAYEVDSNKSTKAYENNKKKNKNKKKSEIKEYYGNEEDEEISGQLCCLQALKLSAGKMNLGIGKPNLVKISKAIRGIGWLHQVTKHSKKVHNNGDRY